MLNDSYVEQAFRAKPEGSFYLKMTAMVLLTLLGVPVFLFFGGIGMIVSIVGICLICAFAGDGKVEYEYTLTNGSVDVAAVYNASKRKEKLHFELEQVTMIVPEPSLRTEQLQFSRIYKFTSGSSKEGLVALVLDENGVKKKVILEPNERTLEHLKTFAKDKCYDL